MTASVITVVLIFLFLLLGFLYPWVIMAALLATPVFKLALIFYLPFFRVVDPTALVCALALLLGLWNYFRRARLGRPLMIPWPMLLCMVGLAGMLFVGLLYTTAPDYGFRKALRFAGISIPFLLLPSFYVRCKEDGHAMIKMVILVGAVTALFLIWKQESEVARHVTGGWGRTKVLGGAAGISAQIVGLSILTVLTAFSVKGSSSRFLRYAGLIGLPLGLAAVLLSGSRASLLYLLFVAAFLPLLSGARQRGRAMFVLALVVPVVLIGVFSFLARGGWDLAPRWTGFIEGRGTAIQSRTRLWAFVGETWWMRPVMGHGSGSFAMDYMGVDDTEAPHNIIVEALYEEGLVGAGILLLFFGLVARTALRGLAQIPEDSPRDRLLVVAPLVMVLFLGLRSMSSVDIEQMRFLYLACGLLHANVSHLVYSNRQMALAPSMGPVPMRV